MMKRNPLSWGKKVTADSLDYADETLPETKGCLRNISGEISKLIWMKFKNSLGNVSHSTFLSG